MSDASNTEGEKQAPRDGKGGRVRSPRTKAAITRAKNIANAKKMGVYAATVQERLETIPSSIHKKKQGGLQKPKKGQVLSAKEIAKTAPLSKRGLGGQGITKAWLPWGQRRN
jgi:hypothetical protein